ncbi:hypothetical protein DEO72_LG5g1149 [Vigna unguiculata]|uniref:Uncharacterized protein n=1 Tax=Vigna unguiculata TaxID=3917 RepID=A0A4D6LXK5_VIGUN|nr:hypothetical protein DEO72_LG5g1149 [Vigna unguiculata]
MKLCMVSSLKLLYQDSSSKITRPLRLNSKRVNAYELEKVELDKVQEFETCPG